jgi:prepilin-type N-terminal cleavage/methylation domain-containing protein
MKEKGFTLIELLAAMAIVLVLGAVMTGAGWKVYESSSLAVSANNIRQLAAGASAYLGDNNYTFWKYREGVPGEGVRWWFGMEPTSSLSAGEGNRTFDPARGPLGAYVPAGVRPDPSFAFTGKAFKPKYRSGYLGIAYNVLLGNADGNRSQAWIGIGEPLRFWQLEKPEQTVVFATSAQVNSFQRPASPSNPMIEEFYGLDDREVTVHFRHRGNAMVAYASGNVGFLPLEESTLDPRAPEAGVGRFAPRGSLKYLR